MKLFKSRSVIPPGGWRFRQPQTGWPSAGEFAKMAVGFTFDQWVNAIIAHRQANPRFGLATDPETVGNELELHTALVVRLHRGSSSYFASQEAEPPKSEARPSQPEAAGTAAGIVEKASRITAGARTILDWLGSGGRAVDQEKANARAKVCLTCPQNRPAHWSEWAKDKLAQGIKQEIEAKLQMNLTTPHDHEILTCNACLCWLPLKVWCPIKHIRSYTTAEVEAALDIGCWYFNEIV